MMKKDKLKKVQYCIHELSSLLVNKFKIDEKTAQFYAQYYFAYSGPITRYDLDEFYNLQNESPQRMQTSYNLIIQHMNYMYSLDGNSRLSDFSIVTP